MFWFLAKQPLEITNLEKQKLIWIETFSLLTSQRTQEFYNLLLRSFKFATLLFDRRAEFRRLLLSNGQRPRAGSLPMTRPASLRKTAGLPRAGTGRP